MQASIAIPHLKKGQLVREWGKDYTAEFKREISDYKYYFRLKPHVRNRTKITSAHKT